MAGYQDVQVLSGRKYLKKSKNGSLAITTADDPSGIPRVKPLKYQYEAEIVKYARHNKVRYFSTECTYAPGAHRGNIRYLSWCFFNIL